MIQNFSLILVIEHKLLIGLDKFFNAKFNFRYHELSEKEILDHLVHQQRYDKRERPPSEGNEIYVHERPQLLEKSDCCLI